MQVNDAITILVSTSKEAAKSDEDVEAKDNVVIVETKRGIFESTISVKRRPALVSSKIKAVLLVNSTLVFDTCSCDYDNPRQN